MGYLGSQEDISRQLDLERQRRKQKESQPKTNNDSSEVSTKIMIHKSDKTLLSKKYHTV